MSREQQYIAWLKRPRYQGALPPCCDGNPLEVYPQDDDGTFRTGGANAKAERSRGDWRYYLHERAFFHSIGTHNDEHIAMRLGVSWPFFKRGLIRAGLTVNDGQPERWEE